MLVYLRTAHHRMAKIRLAKLNRMAKVLLLRRLSVVTFRLLRLRLLFLLAPERVESLSFMLRVWKAAHILQRVLQLVHLFVDLLH